MLFRVPGARQSIFLILAIFAAIPAFAQSDALSLAGNYVTSSAGRSGLTAGDVSNRRLSSSHRNALNGVTHVYYVQQHQGIDVFNAIYSLAVTPAGQVVAPVSRFVPNLAAKVNTTTPQLTSSAAVARAAGHLGITTRPPEIAPALMFVRAGKGVRLSWAVTLKQDSNNIWMMKIDAVNGELLHKMNMVQNDSYKVFAAPAESPNHLSPGQTAPFDGRTIVTGAAADPVASPYGWHDTDGVAGADTNNTTGNNVVAQTDLPLVPGQAVADDELTPVIDVQPASDTRTFDYPVDFSLNPDTYREAVVTNLFYWNNVIHDTMYRYGFDEAAGNFQGNNYGRGGEEGDAVIADAQDGSGTNNANFSTPADGSAPRMQMFIWNPSKGNEVVVNSPSGLGTYEAGAATFGKQLDAAGVTGEVVLVNDGAGVTWDFCEPMAVGSLAGKIALAERGTCNFTVKAQNADRAGAAGLIIVNNQGDNETLTMGSLTPQTDPLILTPTQMLGRVDGNELKNNLPANVTMRNVGGNIPRRDSDFDNAVIIHEYGHGISIRLTGGPAEVSCLDTPQQGGEGWSDWFAMVLTARPGHTATTPRGMGTYLTFEDDPSTGRGIRPYPYTTDMNVNPQTYGELAKGKLTVPHGVGSVWATMLWDMYWALVGGVAERNLPALGFNPNLNDLSGTLAGNQIALRLVTDGLKLQPCSPSFVDARDAILEADRINFGGRYACYIWWAFARRGLGVNADDGDGSLDVGEDFSTPQSCTAGACLVSPQFGGAHSVVSATDGSSRLTVRWSAAVPNCGTGAVTYSVHRATESAFTPTAANRIATGVTATSYSDTSVSSGVRYFYVVRATDSLGNTDANVRRRSGVPAGSLDAAGIFFDDAGDSRPEQFVPTSAVQSWSVRGTGGVAESKTYATTAAGDYPAYACMQLESDTIYLGPDPDLQFFTSYQIEPAWDGGIVEVATEDGNFSDWTKLETIHYPGVMNGPSGDPACSNPGLADGQLAFNGATPTFVPFLGSLAEYANQNVRVRFVFGSDAGTALGGWLIDNISVDDVRAAGPLTSSCFEDDASQIAYSSGWHRVADSDASGGAFRFHTGKSPSHNLVFDFEVTGESGSITYHYARSAKGGTADVYVDGVQKGTIDFRGSAPDARNPEFGFDFRVEGLTPGAHRFELRNLRDAVYVDRFCVTNASSNASPLTVPGVTSISNGPLAVAAQTLTSLTLPAAAQELAVTAGSTPSLPIRLVVLNQAGRVLGMSDSTSGLATVDLTVQGGATYLIKVLNLGAGPVEVWTAATPLLRK